MAPIIIREAARNRRSLGKQAAAMIAESAARRTSAATESAGRRATPRKPRATRKEVA
jgi:hypothetical protein